MIEPTVGYRAFLSYSHRDSVAARRIHRAIETYRLPAKLIGTQTPRGTVPARLNPVFRDREELSAGHDLSQQVQDALAASDALIILCSPAAKASEWVGKEIETFRALHPDRPILAALIEGEPADAFPTALTADGAHEPVAADFRKGADGFALARLKLIAGLTGLGLDALVQRDAQRNFRRVMAVTLVGAAALLIMAALLVMALRAGAEAKRQRAEAEGLVEYMLTDLRDRLKGVGRLDVMAAVNNRAMGYYTNQATLGDLPPESLERRARILHAMGEDDEKRGDLAAALKKFEEAHRTTTAVLAKAPGDADAIFAHAQSEYWVGRIYELRKEWPRALQRYRQYALGARALHRAAPDNAKYMMEMAWSHLNIGIVETSGFAAHEKARESFSNALSWFNRAKANGATRTDIDAEIANCVAWIADTYYFENDFAKSVELRRLQVNIQAGMLARNADDRNREYELALAERALGHNLGRLGNFKEANFVLQQALERANSLTKFEKQSVNWRNLANKIESDQKYLINQ